MGKPRDLANLISTGNPLADGAIAVSEISDLTATAAELNIMDGVTATTAELNHVDGVTSNVQTQMDTKAPTADPTFTGTLAAPTINASTKLQVNGTDVITNARALSNITSVDATTAAAITAGGVGGGGIQSFTATGAISAGQVVGLRSDGTVEVISQSTSTTPTIEGTVEISQNFYSYLAATYDSTNNKVVIVYTDQDASNYVYARAGAISGTNISWESQTLVMGITGLVGTAVYDPDQDRTLAFIKRTGTDDEVYVYALDSSGTSISNIGQIGNIQSQSNILSYSAVYDTNANKTVFIIETGGPSTTSFVCTLTNGNTLDIQNSGSTCSVVEGDQISAYNAEQQAIVFDSNSNKIVFMYKNAASSAIFVVVGTVSGTSCSWAGHTLWFQGPWTVPVAAFDTNSNEFLVVYRESGGSIRANVGSLSGSTVTFSSNQTIDSNTSSNYPAIAFDDNTNRFCITYRVHTSNNGVALFATLSNSTASFSSTTTFSTDNYVRYPPNANHLLYDDNAQRFIIVYRVSDNDYHTTVIAGVSSNVSSWIGVAAEAISNGASGDITILGGVNENQTGLTINTVYYAQPAGGIGTTSQDYKVGRAISATKLLITEGNA